MGSVQQALLAVSVAGDGGTPPVVVSDLQTGASAQSPNFNYNSATGDDRLLVVFTFFWNDSRDITAVSYNGVALTKIGTNHPTGGGGTRSMQVWYLFGPATGTNTLAVTGTGAGADKQVSAITLTGASQSVAPTAFNNNGSSTTPSVNVTGDTDTLFVDCVGQNDISATQTDAGAGQTDLGGHIEGSNQQVDSSHKAGEASTSMSWTMNGNNDWVHCAVSVPPV